MKKNTHVPINISTADVCWNSVCLFRLCGAIGTWYRFCRRYRVGGTRGIMWTGDRCGWQSDRLWRRVMYMCHCWKRGFPAHVMMILPVFMLTKTATVSCCVTPATCLTRLSSTVPTTLQADNSFKNKPSGGQPLWNEYWIFKTKPKKICLSPSRDNGEVK